MAVGIARFDQIAAQRGTTSARSQATMLLLSRTRLIHFRSIIGLVCRGWLWRRTAESLARRLSPHTVCGVVPIMLPPPAADVTHKNVISGLPCENPIRNNADE